MELLVQYLFNFPVSVTVSVKYPDGFCVKQAATVLHAILQAIVRRYSFSLRHDLS